MFFPKYYKKLSSTCKEEGSNNFVLFLDHAFIIIIIVLKIKSFLIYPSQYLETNPIFYKIDCFPKIMLYKIVWKGIIIQFITCLPTPLFPNSMITGDKWAKFFFMYIYCKIHFIFILWETYLIWDQRLLLIYHVSF